MAIQQYAADNNGALPAGITSSAQAISDTAADICSDLVPTYIAALPVDPTTGTAFTDCTEYATGYTVTTSAANNRVTVAAPGAERGVVIGVTR